MSTTFIFEELDDATREYLTAVRDSEGRGAPGIFAATSDSLPGCGCIAGPIVIIATLLCTLTTWLDVIYNDPVGVAFLQTAGLLVGGWLAIAGFRGKGGSKNAGTWVYADPLHLYEAFREQVTVTPIDAVEDANYTHNYDSNGNYQNSVVNIMLGRRNSASVTLKNEARAEHMVTFLNYLAWARKEDGGQRGELAPADLGGLAKYVVRNGDEPKDSENNINLNLVELDITEVPEQPTRDHGSVPAFLPYVFIFFGGLVCFFIMGFVINPVVRDDAIFDLVTKETNPPSMEPRFLRAYLVDRRNKLHREQVTAKLAKFYAPAINDIPRSAADPRLGQGMGDVLKGLSTADQPVVSLRCTETRSPAGSAGSKDVREKALREKFAEGVNKAFEAQPWGKPITLAAGLVPRPDSPLVPIGHQLIAFVEPPEEAKAVHFDIAYSAEDAGNGQYRVVVSVTIRPDIEKNDEERGVIEIKQTFAALDDAALTAIKDELVRCIVGPVPAAGVVLPGGFQPPVFP